MKLTDAAIRKARQRSAAYKLSDGRGLHLLITPHGAKWWRYRYQFNGLEKMLSLGVYPEVTLAAARDRLFEARRILASGLDPSAERKKQKAARLNRFEAIARDWLASLERHVRAEKRSIKTFTKAQSILETYVFPDLGPRPVGEISASELLRTLKKIEARGMHETARRAKQRCGQIFRHAVGLGLASRDPTVELRGLLEAPIVTHHASLTDPKEIGALLRKLDSYGGRPATLCALKLAPLLFVRPLELRTAQWSAFNLEKGEWRISARIMKMDVQHIVPLSRQAVAILKELQEITGNGRYLFPALGDVNKPMCENTINDALRRLGYSGKDMTGHGFRSMASTLLNEHGWHPDAIERQLAHGESNDVRAAYNYAEYLPERVLMMQAWANYLDDLRARKLNTTSLDHRSSAAASRTSMQRQLAPARARPSNCSIP